MSRLPVRPPQLGSMQTEDGVRLDADIYRPQADGDFPVLLLRQAYGRRVAATVCYAHPSWYASQGYVVVVQDVRGRGSSEGRFDAFEHEAADGAASVRWAASLPGSNGAVGMYGFSYQGTNQLLAAPGAGPALRALAPAMFGWDVRRDWATEGEALRLSSALGWGIQVGADSARHGGDEEAYLALHTASRALPLGERLAADPAVMQRHGGWSHYRRWLETPADDPYWARISPSSQAEALRALDLPMLFVAGWYDGWLNGTLDAFHALSGPAARHRLVVGPWLHFPWTRRVGALDFGAEAAGGLDRLHVAWFDRWLKGREPDDPGPEHALPGAPLRLFDMGENRWRSLRAWPAATTSHALQGGGRVSVDATDGVLLSPGRTAEPGMDSLVHDPWRPVPCTGGPFGAPAGPQDRSATDSRTDVLTFTGETRQAPLTLAGDVVAVLFVDSDAASFDLSVVVSRVAADGRVFPLTEAYRRLASHRADQPVRLACPGTCVTLKPGEALRLSVAAASYPAYGVNPGSGARAETTPISQAQIITLTLHYGPERPSALLVGTLPETAHEP